MGDKAIHAEATQQEGGLSSYSVVTFHAHELPDAYEALIYSKWMRSLRYGNDLFKLMDPDAYYGAYQRFIANVLSRLDAVVKIAVLTDDKDVVLGFSVSRGPVLDYVHVHKDFRRLGIGGRLVPEGITTITQLTRTAMTIWGSKFRDWKYNPFA